MNNKGQSLLEAVFSTFVMLQFMTVFCLCFYVIFLSAWIPHILYELNICKISYNANSSCESKARKNLNSVLLGISYQLSTYKLSKKQGSLLRFKLSNTPAPITFREEVEL